jgi:hypothetical protein
MMKAGHKGTWLVVVVVVVVVVIIIIHYSINYSCFVYLHNNVFDKADRTVVIILVTSTLTMEAANPSETSATSPPDAAHVKNQDNLTIHDSAT